MVDTSEMVIGNDTPTARSGAAAFLVVVGVVVGLVAAVEVLV